MGTDMRYAADGVFERDGILQRQTEIYGRATTFTWKVA